VLYRQRFNINYITMERLFVLITDIKNTCKTTYTRSYFSTYNFIIFQ